MFKGILRTLFSASGQNNPDINKKDVDSQLPEASDDLREKEREIALQTTVNSLALGMFSR